MLITLTQQEIETYTKRVYDALLMDNILTEMVIFKIQKLGNEATKSLTYNDTVQSFMIDYPVYILRGLDAIKKRIRLL